MAILHNTLKTLILAGLYWLTTTNGYAAEQQAEPKFEFKLDADEEELEIYDYHSGYTYQRNAYHYLFNSAKDLKPSDAHSKDAPPVVNPPQK